MSSELVGNNYFCRTFGSVQLTRLAILICICICLSIISLVVFNHASHFPTILSKDFLPKGLQSDDKLSVLRKLICEEDAKRLHTLSTLNDTSQLTNALFFSSVMYPVQSACENLKRIGGQWFQNGFDGTKYVCMDDFADYSEPCLIYSFGLGGDVSFEHTMAQFGCLIHGYDHTISESAKARMEMRNFNIHLAGLAAERRGNMTTFKEELLKNGHMGSTVTYLKIDIEGWEAELLPLWLSSGLLDKVKQIGVEFHNVKEAAGLSKYFRITQDLFRDGFKLISFDPNYYVGQESADEPLGTLGSGFMTYFEVVFRRVKTKCKFDAVAAGE